MPIVYKIGSAINFAEGLQGKLLVIHGSGDDKRALAGHREAGEPEGRG